MSEPKNPKNHRYVTYYGDGETYYNMPQDNKYTVVQGPDSHAAPGTHTRGWGGPRL